MARDFAPNAGQLRCGGMAAGFEQWIRDAPKAELHLHLRGAMPAEFFAAQLRKYSLETALSGAPERHLRIFRSCPNLTALLASAEGSPDVAPLFEFDSFDAFLATYLLSSYFIRDIEDFRELIDAVLADLEKQNIVYAEITVSLVEYLNRGIRIEAIRDALDEAAARGRPRVRWIVDLVRNVGPETALDLLRRLLAARPKSWVGITLGGAEHLFPPAQFRDAFDLARAEGLRLSVHAGEALGPESVWDAVRILKVDRVGHGVRAVEDPRLLDYLAEKRIPLEICPTSNVATGVYSSFEEHPLPRLLAAGVALTINSDDPTFFRTTLAGEFLRALEMGVGEATLKEIRENGFRHAFAETA